MKNILYTISIVLVFISCDDVVNPTLPEADPILVVDAFITNQNEPQSIFVTRTQPFFEGQFPDKVSNATVFIEDNEGNRFDFIENDSAYTWTPTSGVFGTVGNEYDLTVIVGSETFVSSTRMNRVPEIDSITFVFNESDLIVDEDYFNGEFTATDFVGVGDTYWIKAFKNGEFLNKPSEINIAYDAAFSRNSVDGVVFIQPIQEGVNPFDEDPEDDNRLLPPYEIGDDLRVEIHSISEQTFDFLNEVRIQTDRPGGFAALFDVPLANVSSNILNADEDSDAMALGFFNVAAVTSLSGTLTEDVARLAEEMAQ